jgi:hypothetical protein
MKINLDINLGINNSIKKLYEKEIIKEDTIIIIPVIDNLDSILKIRDNYKNKLILVLYENLSSKIKDYNNIELITIPNMMNKEEIKYMASDIKEEFSDAYIFDLYDNKYLESYFTNIAKEIYKNNQGYNKIYIPYNGSISIGLINYFKIATDLDVILISDNEIKNIEYDLKISKKEEIDDENSIVISF